MKRKLYQTYWFWIVIGLFLFFGVPKLIDWAYLIGSDEPNTTLSSNDVINYYSKVLSLLVTIGGAIYTRVNRIKERKNNVKPILESSYRHIYSDKFINSMDVDKVYITINSKDDKYPIHNSDVAPNWIKYERKKDGIENEMFLSSNFMSRILCVQYKLKNIGSNVAKNITFQINKELALPTFSLINKSEKIINFIFILEDYELGEEKELELYYSFTNIDDSDKYEGYERFTVFKDKDGGLSSRQHPDDFLVTKEVIE